MRILIILAVLHTTFTYADKIFIQPAQQKHIPEIVALDKEVVDEFYVPTMIAGYPELFAHNKELLDTVNDTWNEHIALLLKNGTSNENNNNQHILIASDEKEPDKILGFCLFTKQEDYIHIQHLIIVKQARGKGIGTKLLDNALSTYKDIHICNVETLARNNDATRAFYEKYGFKEKEFCTLDERMPNGSIVYELHLKK